MSSAEPRFAIVDCVSSERPTELSAAESLCGRPLFMFASIAAMRRTDGPVWVRVPAEEQVRFLALAGGEPRLQIVADDRLRDELASAGDAPALVLSGHLVLDDSVPVENLPAGLMRIANASALQLELTSSACLLERPANGPNPAPLLTSFHLAAAEAQRYADRQERLLREGVVIHGRVLVDEDVRVDPGAILESGVHLRGATCVSCGARIDVGSVLTDVVVGLRALVKPYTVASRARIGEGAEVGPFSHLRDGSDIHSNARIGNFVETKNVVVRERAMANHLAYMGDGDVGEGANISAGTIFCNSDGVNKFRTEVGAGAFVGSDCQLVAPVKIGAGAFVATGTTVTADVPADALAIARQVQQNKPDYAPRLRARFAAIAAERKKGSQT